MNEESMAHQVNPSQEWMLKHSIIPEQRVAGSRKRQGGGDKMLQKGFNCTVARYELAMGQPYRHKVQKCTLCDTKSDHRVGSRGTKPTRTGEGEEGRMALRAYVA